MSFEDRKKPEDDYIKWFLERNKGHVQNINGILPDITKPNGCYLEIKVIERDRWTYNIVVQCHGFHGRCEIDDWSENGVLDKTDFKIICPDKKIMVISGKILWATECTYWQNKEKNYQPKHLNIIERIEKETKDTSSRTAFYLFNIKNFLPCLEQIKYEKYDGKKLVYEYKQKEDTLAGWM